MKCASSRSLVSHSYCRHIRPAPPPLHPTFWGWIYSEWYQRSRQKTNHFQMQLLLSFFLPFFSNCGCRSSEEPFIVFAFTFRSHHPTPLAQQPPADREMFYVLVRTIIPLNWERLIQCRCCMKCYVSVTVSHCCFFLPLLLCCRCEMCFTPFCVCLCVCVTVCSFRVRCVIFASSVTFSIVHLVKSH